MTTGPVFVPWEEAVEKLPERIHQKLAIEHGCWVWYGPLDRDGYGRCYIKHPRQQRAHRTVWTLLIGPIPEGLMMDHLCRNRRCVNPEHLEIVTPRVNVLRGDTVTSRNLRKTHCPQGHPYSEENTGYTGRSRWCRTCKRDKDREKRARKTIESRSLNPLTDCRWDEIRDARGVCR